MNLVHPTHYLDEITVAARGKAMYDQLLIETIQKARDASVSWAAIGAALGVSRQAATERYRKLMRVDTPVGYDSRQWNE